MLVNNLNYKNNSMYEKCLPEGLINGQGMGAVKRYRYGAFSFGWCGCEIIAVYNLLKLYGKPEKLCDICREIYPYGHILLGFFGTNVYTLKHYYKKHAVPVKAITNKAQFLNEGAKSKYGTVSFWTKRVMASSIHTVAYSIDENGEITVYNRYNNKDCEYHFRSFHEAFGKYPFIVANIM